MVRAYFILSVKWLTPMHDVQMMRINVTDVQIHRTAAVPFAMSKMMVCRTVAPCTLTNEDREAYPI